ncbi:hypothetical protein HUS23_08740 [Ectothiorhodospiraceae bacterium 2226]|nr:hypothetical protein HUS23_08740 [Ectothiorhodospiraceae bacterium 2226]
MRLYSRRLLSPFVGLVQVAEIPWARALSLDGRNWAIQYSLAEDGRFPSHANGAHPDVRYSLVATITGGHLTRRAAHPIPIAVHTATDRLFEAINGATPPFPAADRYEYWLLDSADARPLALLQSCVEPEDMALPPPRPSWIAMPAAQLDVPEPEPVQDVYVPPVNYRLQQLIEERAGSKPRGAWFERQDDADAFPPCLIREDWGSEEEQRLCDLYIRRLAPRLLMMHGLPRPVRERLEHAARAHALEVERFHPLYPEVVDDRLLTAARVEARLRRANEAAPDDRSPE